MSCLAGLKAFRDFLYDYGQRHKHPVNAVLHIIGVPSVILGLFLLIGPGRREKHSLSSWGLLFVVFGYFLQYLGHRSQGNEVGEVILVKKAWRGLLQGRRRPGAGAVAVVSPRAIAPGAIFHGDHGNGNGNSNGNGHDKGPLTLIWWRKNES